MEASSESGKQLKSHVKERKSKPAQFGRVADGVQKRREEMRKSRRSSQSSLIDNLRNISICDRPAPAVNPARSEAELKRQLELQKWKEEKEKKKKEAGLLKKKPFITGVSRAPHKYLTLPPPPVPMPSSSRRATQAQPAKPTTVKPKEIKAASRSFAPQNASFKPPDIKTLSEIPKLVPPKTKKLDMTFDPVLPTTQTEKPTKSLLDEDTSVEHFRRQLASETKRLTQICAIWDKILEQTVLPESVQEAVLSVVGQTRLLMSQKLQQFASLVERCARPEPGAALITPADLHGFWDMVFLQVENLDIGFKKLEELRLCGWVEEQPVEVKKKVVRPTVNVKKAAKPTAGPSRLKEIIAAARTAKKEQESTLQSPPADRKTFDAGFFSVSSPSRSPANVPSSPARIPGSPSKAVLSSGQKRASATKNSTSFAMLRASVLGKSVEHDGSSLLPQTPVPKTPITSMDLEKVENKEISRRSKLVLQVAEDRESGAD